MFTKASSFNYTMVQNDFLNKVNQGMLLANAGSGNDPVL